MSSKLNRGLSSDEMKHSSIINKQRKYRINQITPHYGVNEINFYRRIKPRDYISEGLTYLLLEKELLTNPNKNSVDVNSSNSNKQKYNFSPEHKFNPKLFFPKSHLDKIYKIRDLFLSFDADQSRTLDMDELYEMFNINDIPISYKQLSNMFNNKKTLTFLDLVNFILKDSENDNFRKVMREMKRKIIENENNKKANTINTSNSENNVILPYINTSHNNNNNLNKGTNVTTNAVSKFIPTDFNEMLENFSDKGQLRDNMKNINYGIDKLKGFDKNIITTKQNNETLLNLNSQTDRMYQNLDYSIIEQSFADVLDYSKNKVTQSVRKYSNPHKEEKEKKKNIKLHTERMKKKIQKRIDNSSIETQIKTISNNNQGASSFIMSSVDNNNNSITILPTLPSTERRNHNRHKKKIISNQNRYYNSIPIRLSANKHINKKKDSFRPSDYTN